MCESEFIGIASSVTIRETSFRGRNERERESGGKRKRGGGRHLKGMGGKKIKGSESCKRKEVGHLKGLREEVSVCVCV